MELSHTKKEVIDHTSIDYILTIMAGLGCLQGGLEKAFKTMFPFFKAGVVVLNVFKQPPKPP